MEEVIFDYSKLKGKIREKNETQETLAKKLGISTTSLNYKLNGKNNFSLVEVFKLSKMLDISDLREYFFLLKTRKSKIKRRIQMEDKKKRTRERDSEILNKLTEFRIIMLDIKDETDNSMVFNDTRKIRDGVWLNIDYDIKRTIKNMNEKDCINKTQSKKLKNFIQNKFKRIKNKILKFIR